MHKSASLNHYNRGRTFQELGYLYHNPDPPSPLGSINSCEEGHTETLRHARSGSAVMRTVFIRQGYAETKALLNFWICAFQSRALTSGLAPKNLSPKICPPKICLPKICPTKICPKICPKQIAKKSSKSMMSMKADKMVSGRLALQVGSKQKKL